MIMDLRTIYLMDAALYLMLHAAIWVGLLSYRSRLVAAWSLSGIVSAAGLVFLGMRGVWPDWTLVICGQFLMAAGNFGRQITLRSMLGSIPRLWWWGTACSTWPTSGRGWSCSYRMRASGNDWCCCFMPSTPSI